MLCCAVLCCHVMSTGKPAGLTLRCGSPLDDNGPPNGLPIPTSTGEHPAPRGVVLYYTAQGFPPLGPAGMASVRARSLKGCTGVLLRGLCTKQYYSPSYSNTRLFNSPLVSHLPPQHFSVRRLTSVAHLHLNLHLVSRRPHPKPTSSRSHTDEHCHALRTHSEAQDTFIDYHHIHLHNCVPFCRPNTERYECLPLAVDFVSLHPDYVASTQTPILRISPVEIYLDVC